MDLDSILDQALDDFEEAELNTTAAKMAAAADTSKKEALEREQHASEGERYCVHTVPIIHTRMYIYTPPLNHSNTCSLK